MQTPIATRLSRARVAGACVVALLAIASSACGELTPGAAGYETGLQRRAQIPFPLEGPHLGELATFGEHVYVANSFDSFTALRLGPAGALELTLDRPPTTGTFIRCTTLAVHEPSRTLYCASDRGAAFAYDLSDPAVPRLRKPFIDDPELHVRDLHVDGDRLLLARFEDGLWYAEIAPDGDLGAPQLVAAAPGNVHHAAADGARVVAMTAGSELTQLAWTGAAYEARGALALDGPPLDLSLRGERVAVALGSAGVVVAALSESGFKVVHHVHPPTVATSADLDGDALAVVGLSGIFLYDLADADADDEPRVAGFVGQGPWGYTRAGAALSGRFVSGDLIVSDWAYIDRLGVALVGDVHELDLPGSVYARRGEEVAFSARNPGRATLRLRVENVAGEEVISETFGPGEQRQMTLAPGSIEQREVQELYLYTELLTPEGDAIPTLEDSLRVVLRADGGDERPAPGQRFPTVRYADQDAAVQQLPASRRFRVIFHSQDCAAMWPEILDAAWLARRDALDGGAWPLLLSAEDIELYGYPARWGVEDVARGHYLDAYSTPAEVSEFNAPHEHLYSDMFLVDELHSGAAHPTDYLVTADGVVEAVEREYRGAYPLR
ncbi:MAG: hypothetical protein H6713_12985 [Myxococcales bacterium]|nr:hypothetical protein [Myxococcales bacterium]